VATVVEPEIENVQRAVMFVVMNADNSQKKKHPLTTHTDGSKRGGGKTRGADLVGE
jgi:hypothetical protein